MVITALHDYLATRLATATLNDAARTLCTSARSLQRHLREQGTSFRTELINARINAAKRMLDESDDKLVAVAQAVGYNSPQILNALFKRETGQTPGQFRRRVARAPGLVAQIAMQ